MFGAQFGQKTLQIQSESSYKTKYVKIKLNKYKKGTKMEPEAMGQVLLS